jgi:hypothetical protein
MCSALAKTDKTRNTHHDRCLLHVSELFDAFSDRSPSDRVVSEFAFRLRTPILIGLLIALSSNVGLLVKLGTIGVEVLVIWKFPILNARGVVEVCAQAKMVGLYIWGKWALLGIFRLPIHLLWLVNVMDLQHSRKMEADLTVWLTWLRFF